MERLVFNTAEHKLEELEKYGFVEKENCYSLSIEHIYYNDTHPSYSEKQIYITIGKITMQVLFIYSIKLKNTEESKNSIVLNGVCEYETNLGVLYDPIKDGLVVKEKHNDNK